MTIDEKKVLIEQAVRAARNSSYEGDSKSVPVSTGQTWSELKPKQIVAIAKNLGIEPDEESMVLFYDTTVFNSGKSGILITSLGITWEDLLKRAKKGKREDILLRFDAIRAVRQAKVGEDLSIFTDGTSYITTSYMVIEYNDGRVESVYGSIYCQFIVGCLRRVIRTLYRSEERAAQAEAAEAKVMEAELTEPELQEPELQEPELQEPELTEPEQQEAELAEPNLQEPELPEPEPVEQDQPDPNLTAPQYPAEPDNEEDLSNIITLTDPDGNPMYFEFLDLIPYEDEEYVVLLPVDENDEPEEGEIVILKIQPDPNDPEMEEYVPVPDDQTLQDVFALFRDKFRDLYDFQEPEPEQRPDEEESFLPIPYSGTDPYIFISYSHKDSEQVMGIIRQLMADGYRVWYDEGIDPGTEWDDNIAAHVEKCGCFIAFISKNYLQSENCKDELNYARDLNLSRLLIYLENVELTGGMAMRHNRLQAVHYYKYQKMKGMFYQRLYESSVLINSSVR